MPHSERDVAGASAIVRTIAARLHGRYLVETAPGAAGSPVMLVGFHGYGERAEHMLEALRRIRGARPWLLVSVQALHRFYTRADEIVASWMTREDREHAIADNVAYVASVVAQVRRDHATGPIVYAGFSQGVAMAYRAMAFAHRHADIPAARGGIALAGDLPPDVAPAAASLPPVLIGRGAGDAWYTAEKSASDVTALASAGVPVMEHVFEGGHEWNESFIETAAEFVERLSPGE